MASGGLGAAAPNTIITIVSSGKLPVSSFEPAKKTAVREEISARLLSLVKEKQLKPGDKLPPDQ